MEVRGDQMKIFFVDYGDTEWVTNNMVQNITHELLNVCELHVNGGLYSLVLLLLFLYL